MTWDVIELRVEGIDSGKSLAINDDIGDQPLGTFRQAVRNHTGFFHAFHLTENAFYLVGENLVAADLDHVVLAPHVVE